MLDPVIAAALFLGLGTLFLLGAVHKATALAEFRTVLAGYRVLPENLVKVTALAVTAVEAGIGLAWLLLADKRAVATATIVLLLVYAGAIALNLLRGRRHIDCGCSFGRSAGGGEFLSGWLVGRNLVLAALAATAGLPVINRTLGALDYVTLAAALAAGTLLFATANQLIQNRAAAGGSRRSRIRND